MIWDGTILARMMVLDGYLFRCLKCGRFIQEMDTACLLDDGEGGQKVICESCGEAYDDAWYWT